MESDSEVSPFDEELTVSLILESWDMPRCVIDKFEAEEVDNDAFLCLKEDDIKELIGKVGLRAKFQKHYQAFKDLNNNQKSDQVIESKPEEEITEEIPSCSRENVYIEEQEDIPNENLNCQLSDEHKEHKASPPVGPSEWSPSSFFSTEVLTSILNKSIDGQLVLSTYSADGSLDNRTRRTLIDIIISYSLEKNIRLTNAHHNLISSVICSVFPKEQRVLYFVKPLEEGPHQRLARGLLPNRYNNKIRVFRKNNLVPRLRNPKRSLEVDFNQSEIVQAPEETEETARAKAWLKVNHDPWTLVLEKWQATSEFRTREIATLKKPTNETILDWPSFNLPSGHNLIDIDFQTQYPAEEANFFLNWNKFIQVTVPLMHFHIKDKAALVTLEQLVKIKDTNDDLKALLFIKLLAAIAPPTARIKVKSEKVVTAIAPSTASSKAKSEKALVALAPSTASSKAKAEKAKYWKPSIVESHEGVIIEVETANQVTAAINKKRDNSFNKGLTQQPFIVVQRGEEGGIECTYVSLNNEVMYSFHSLLKAIDCCFKIFFVFGLNYPPESENVWLLVQRAVYKIITVHDKHIGSVTKLLCELERSAL